MVVLRDPMVLDRSAALRFRSYEVTGMELRFGLEEEEGEELAQNEVEVVKSIS